MKLLLQLADTLVEKGHAHAPNIKQWVEEVRNQIMFGFIQVLNQSLHEKLILNSGG